MEFTIYSVGDGPLMEQIFIAMAMISGAGDYVRAIQIGMLVGIIASMFQSVISGDGGGASPWKSIFLGWLLYMFMFSWPATVKVEEMHSADVRVIANVPGGVAATGSVISTIGYKLSQLFETGYSTILPGSSDVPVGNPLKILMGAMDAAQQSLFINVINDVHASGGDLLKSINNYLMECTYVKMEMGLMTPEKFESDSAAGVLENMRFEHQLYVTELYLDGTSPVTYTCPDGHDRIRQFVNGIDLSASDAIKDAYKGKLSKLDGDEIDALEDVFVELTTAAQTIAHSSNTAHQMVFTSIIQKVHERASAGYYTNAGDTGAAFALNQALQQRALQNAASQSMFERAMLPLMTIMEALFYAITPFLGFAFVVGTFGASILKNYMKLMLWLQLWLPLHSIINLYTLTAANGDMGGFIFNNFYALDTAEHHLAEYMGVAGMLTASIPMLAWALLTGGTSLAMLAGRIGGADHFDEKQLAPDIVRNAPIAQSSSVIGGNADQGWTREGHSVVGQEISLGSQLQQGAAYKRSLSATNSNATMESLSNAYENMTSDVNQQRMSEAVQHQTQAGTDSVSKGIQEWAKNYSKAHGYDQSRSDEIVGQIGLGLANIGGNHRNSDVQRAVDSFKKDYQEGNKFSEEERATFAQSLSKAASNSIDRIKTDQDAVKYLDTAQEQSGRAVADAEMAEKAESLSNNASVSQKGYANSFFRTLDAGERAAIGTMAAISSDETKAHIASQQQFYEQAGYGADAKLAAQFAALAKGVGASDEDRFENVSTLADMVGGKWQANDLHHRVDSSQKDIDLNPVENKPLEKPADRLPEVDLKGQHQENQGRIQQNSDVKDDLKPMEESSARQLVNKVESGILGVGAGIVQGAKSLVVDGKGLNDSAKDANMAAYAYHKKENSSPFTREAMQEEKGGAMHVPGWSLRENKDTQSASGMAPAVTWDADSDVPMVEGSPSQDGFPAKDGLVIDDLPKKRDSGFAGSSGTLTDNGAVEGDRDGKQSPEVIRVADNGVPIIASASVGEPNLLSQSVASEQSTAAYSANSIELPERNSSVVPSGDSRSPSVLGFSDDGVPIIAGEADGAPASQTQSHKSQDAASLLSQESQTVARTLPTEQSPDKQADRTSSSTASTSGATVALAPKPHSTERGAVAEDSAVAKASKTAVSSAEGTPVSSGQASGQQTIPVQQTEAGTSGGAALPQEPHSPGQGTVSEAPVIATVIVAAAASAEGDPVANSQVSGQQTIPARQKEAGTSGGAVLPQEPRSPGQVTASEAPVMATATVAAAASSVGDPVASSEASGQQTVSAQHADVRTGSSANVLSQEPHSPGQGETSEAPVMLKASEPAASSSGGDPVARAQLSGQQTVVVQQAEAGTSGDAAALPQGLHSPWQGEASEAAAMASASEPAAALSGGDPVASIQSSGQQTVSVKQAEAGTSGGAAAHPQGLHSPWEGEASKAAVMASASELAAASYGADPVASTQTSGQQTASVQQADAGTSGGAAVLPHGPHSSGQGEASKAAVMARASEPAGSSSGGNPVTSSKLSGQQSVTVQQVEAGISGGAAFLPQGPYSPEQGTASEAPVMATATVKIAASAGGAPAVSGQGSGQQTIPAQQAEAGIGGGAVLPLVPHSPGQGEASEAPVMAAASETGVASSGGDPVTSTQGSGQQTIPEQQTDVSSGGGAVLPKVPHSSGQGMASEVPVMVAASETAVASVGGAPAVSTQASGKQTVPAQQAEAGTGGGAVLPQVPYSPGQGMASEAPVMAIATVEASASAGGAPAVSTQAFGQQTVPAQQAKAGTGGGAVLPQVPHLPGRGMVSEPPVMAAASETVVASAGSAPVASGQAPGQQTVPVQQTEEGTSGGGAVFPQVPYSPGQSAAPEAAVMSALSDIAPASVGGDPVASAHASRQQTDWAQHQEVDTGVALPLEAHSPGQGVVFEAPVMATDTVAAPASAGGPPLANVQASGQQTVPAQQADVGSGGGANVLSQEPQLPGQGSAAEAIVMASVTEPIAASAGGVPEASVQASGEQTNPAQQVGPRTGDSAALPLEAHSLGQGAAFEAPVMASTSEPIASSAGGAPVASIQASGEQTVQAQQAEVGSGGGTNVLSQEPQLPEQGKAVEATVTASASESAAASTGGDPVAGQQTGPAPHAEVDSDGGTEVLSQKPQLPEPGKAVEATVMAIASEAAAALTGGDPVASAHASGQQSDRTQHQEVDTGGGANHPQGPHSPGQGVVFESPVMETATVAAAASAGGVAGQHTDPAPHAEVDSGGGANVLSQEPQLPEPGKAAETTVMAIASEVAAALTGGDPVASTQSSGQQSDRAQQAEVGSGGGTEVLPQEPQLLALGKAAEATVMASVSEPEAASTGGDPVASTQASGRQTVHAQQAEVGSGGGTNLLFQEPQLPELGKAAEATVMASPSEPTVASTGGDPVASTQASGEQTVHAQQAEVGSGGGTNVLSQVPHLQGQGEASEVPVMAAASETAVASVVGDPTISPQVSGQQTVPAQPAEVSSGGGANVLSQVPHSPGQDAASEAPVMATATVAAAALSGGAPVASDQAYGQQEDQSREPEVGTTPIASVLSQELHSPDLSESVETQTIAEVSIGDSSEATSQVRDEHSDQNIQHRDTSINNTSAMSQELNSPRHSESDGTITTEVESLGGGVATGGAIDHQSAYKWQIDSVYTASDGMSNMLNNVQPAVQYGPNESTVGYESVHDEEPMPEMLSSSVNTQSAIWGHDDGESVNSSPGAIVGLDEAINPSRFEGAPDAVEDNLSRSMAAAINNDD